jgi:hypothetical protein
VQSFFLILISRKAARLCCWRVVFLLAVLAGATLIGSCASQRVGPGERWAARLESWVVLGHGRHLRLVISQPEGKRAGVEEVVEFTSTLLRSDYDSPEDASRRNRLARMSAGDVLAPMVSEPHLRVEAMYTISREQHEELTRDRVYAATYFLLGPNSNSAMLDCLRDAGLEVPEHVLQGGGVLGQFPGVSIEAGREISASRWSAYGIRRTATKE